MKIILLFLRPAGLDFASGLAGLAGGLRGMSNARRLPQPSYYVPQYSGQVDEMWFSAMQAIDAATDRNTGLVDPVLLQSFSQMMGIDLSALAQAGQQAGQQFGALGETAGYFGDVSQQQAHGAFGQQDALRQAGAQTYQTGLDPQNQLHDRTRQRVVEGSRAADSARGIAMSPYSAGNEAQAVSNFEMDWNNQQLSRQLAGLQGMNQAGYVGNQTGALGGQQLTAGMGYYGMQPGFSMQAASAPIQGQQMQAQLPMDWATQFTQAQAANVQGPQANAASPFGPYMGQAGQIAGQQFDDAFARANLHNQMQQQSMYGLFGGGQSGTNYMQGNQSGFGNPMNWMGGMSGWGASPYGA